jgi:hypothetical protein
MTPRKFMVLEEKPCTKCDSGIIRGGRTYTDPYGNSQTETVESDCSVCYGTGLVLVEVPLVVALRELGIEVTE